MYMNRLLHLKPLSVSSLSECENYERLQKWLGNISRICKTIFHLMGSDTHKGLAPHLANYFRCYCTRPCCQRNVESVAINQTRFSPVGSFRHGHSYQE